MSLLAEYIPENDRAGCAFEAVNLKLFRSFDYFRVVATQLAQSREIAFHVRHENRNAARTEIFCERLQRHCLSSSSCTGDQAMAVGHFREQKDLFLRLCNEDRFRHGLQL